MKIDKYIKYAKYLIKHIWYVRKMCWHNGLYWQGLIHDLSKWRPDEAIPYANYFYGEDGKKEMKDRKDSTGYYKPTDTGDKMFEMAWLLHQKRNPHHWQWWILPKDSGGIKVLEMPEKYAKEMLCDWWGASTAQGHKGQNKSWYETNKDKMQLHPKTREWVENRLQDNEGLYKL